MQDMEEEIMEVIEVAGSSYPTARELPNHGGRPISKHQKSPGGNSTAKNKDNWRKPAGTVKMQIQKADQRITEANQMVMLLINGKRKFIRASEYERLRAELDK